MTAAPANQTLAKLPPLASLTVRRSARGGGLRNSATLSPTALLQGADHVLLYIHGYNNSTLQAMSSYDSFRVGMTRLSNIEQVGVYWPGESMPRRSSEVAAPSRLSVLLSLPTYTLQIANARTSAEMLATRINAEVQHRKAAYIYAKAPLRKLSVSIVAHSLGCRVALELLGQFVRTPKLDLRFPLVALMAAAVPKRLVNRGGDLRKALEHPDDVIVYSSPNDWALGLAFKLSQFPDLPILRWFSRGSHSALGLAGSERTENIHRRHGNRGHSDYWGSKVIAAEVEGAISSGRVPRDLERRLSIPERYVRL